MKEHEVIALAAKLGARVTHHALSGTTQIDGHRWDRWAVLHNKPEPNPLVILQGGRTIVCDGRERIGSEGWDLRDAGMDAAERATEIASCRADCNTFGKRPRRYIGHGARGEIARLAAKYAAPQREPAHA